MTRRTRITLAAVAGAVVVLAAGQLLLPGSRQTHDAAVPVVAAPAVAASSPPPTLVATTRAGVTTTVAGVPTGFAHDRDGAKAAATAFAQTYATLVALDQAGAVAAKRAMASSASADQLVAAMTSKLATLRKVWPVGAISYRVAPLAVRVRMDGPDAASADVWYVGVVAGRGIPTYEEWVTQSFTLVWERDGWRIAAESDAPGPRPDPGRQSPATPAELDARLAGFEAVP